MRLAALLLLLPSLAAADNKCPVVDVNFVPGDKLQIVAWVEDAAGHFVDTIYITQQTGTYGIGNRPGVLAFNSGPNWPYGRRETTFPVWAHRHGLSFPELVFQTGAEDALSHDAEKSSMEMHFCRPLNSVTDQAQWDAGTCASQAFTDKGHFSTTTSLYPPRTDVMYTAGVDSADLEMFAMLNPFDAVTQATPVGGMPAGMSWPIPKDLPAGNYTLFVEASKEFDDNDSYTAADRPGPSGIPYGDYGLPYRGQPSVVYSVPFAVNNTEVIASTQSYIGYGDPEGQDGMLRAPDDTISTDTPGSGGARLQLTSDGTSMYRVQVDAHDENDTIAPGVPDALTLVSSDARDATISFIAPGDDGDVGRVRGYEARFLIGAAMTEANFESGTPIGTTIVPDDPGSLQQFTVGNLLPESDYTIGIRAIDYYYDPTDNSCHTSGPLAVFAFTTPPAPVGAVDACFIATAAYGSVMANDVSMLRRFRDAVLRRSVFGELAVEGYYTFGPALAAVIGESELLRATARDMLQPLVDLARTTRW